MLIYNCKHIRFKNPFITTCTILATILATNFAFNKPIYLSAIYSAKDSQRYEGTRRRLHLVRQDWGRNPQNSQNFLCLIKWYLVITFVSNQQLQPPSKSCVAPRLWTAPQPTSPWWDANTCLAFKNISVKSSFLVCFYLVTKSCLTLCNSIVCSPPDSSFQKTFQAIILEWVAISSSRGSFRPRDRTQDSCIGRQTLYHWATREAPQKPFSEWLKASQVAQW